MSQKCLSVEDVLQIIDGSDSDIGEDDEVDSDDDEEYRPPRTETTDESGSSSEADSDGEDPDFIPVAVQ